MDDTRKHNAVLKKISALHRKKKDILSLPPEKALNAIVESSEPSALVHAFSEEDLYVLIHDIGPEDSLPIIALASQRQWEYIMDVEVWEKDRLALAEMTRWFDLLFRADPYRLIHWALKEKKEFFEFYLFQHVDARFREHDQDPSEFPDGYFTYDDVLYLKFIDRPAHAQDKAAKRFISRFFDRLADADYHSLHCLVLESTGIIPSETEEEAFRLRNVRLAEKGYMPYHEAIGVYQPISIKELQSRGFKSVRVPKDEESFFPVPLLHTQILEKEVPFVEALSRIEAGPILDRLRSEFAGLCNQIISADQKKITRRKDLKQVVSKAGAYIGIGLALLAKKNETKKMHSFSSLIQRFALLDIFRVGYGRVLELKRRAEKWKPQSWFENQGLSLDFWDEAWLGVLGGLLIKRPRYFDNFRTGVLYREFYSIDDIASSEKTLDDIIAFDALLARMQPAISPDVFLTYKRLVLTLWARHMLNLDENILPLSLEQFMRFFNTLWSTTTRPRRIRISAKESFLNWIAGRTGVDPFDISASLGTVLEGIFKELEEEYTNVNPADLDPKYILLFHVQAHTDL